MKKITIYIVLAMLCPFLSGKAQGLKPLKVGDNVPEVAIANILNYKSKTAKISDFRGKLLILDFWATWCAPCIAMMPKMDSLQIKFEGQLQILPVTYQAEAEVAVFLSKLNKGKKAALPTVVGDKALNALFPHTTLPHYVWIDGEGMVKAVTSFEDVNSGKIAQMLAGSAKGMENKVDQVAAIDREKPLFMAGNGNAKNMLFHSVMTGYTEGLGFGFQIKHDSILGARITTRNLTPYQLYQIVYNKRIAYNKDRLVAEVKDSATMFPKLHGKPFEAWAATHTYCYELIVPNRLADEKYKIMEQDLARYLPQYQSYAEERPVKCLALQRTSTEDLLKSKGGMPQNSFGRFGCTISNGSLTVFVNQLNISYLRHLNQPVIDETGYTGAVDLLIDAELGDAAALNTALGKYGLKLVAVERKLPFFIVKEN